LYEKKKGAKELGAHSISSESCPAGISAILVESDLGRSE